MRENIDVFASEVFQVFSVYSEEIINFIVQKESIIELLDEMECAIENWDTIIYLEGMKCEEPDEYYNPKPDDGSKPPHKQAEEAERNLAQLNTTAPLELYKVFLVAMYGHSWEIGMQRPENASLICDLSSKEVSGAITSEEQELLAALISERKAFSGASLAKQSLSTFYSTVIIMLNNLKNLQKVYHRYKITNDFGEDDISKVIPKVNNFLSEKIALPDCVPPSDCTSYIMLCLIFYSGQEIEASEPQTSNQVGEVYEQECYQLLLQSGYSIKETPKTGDFGCDLMAVKSAISFCIQCKMHGKPVGVAAIQQAVSAKDYYDCDFAVVTSESAFTDAALKMANKLNVMCLSSKQLGEIDNLCGQYT